MRVAESATRTPVTALSTRVHTTRTDPTAVRWPAAPSATPIPVPSASTSRPTDTPCRPALSRPSQPRTLRHLPLRRELTWCCPGPPWLSCMPSRGHSWLWVPPRSISPRPQATWGRKPCSDITAWLQHRARRRSLTLYCFLRLGWRLGLGSWMRRRAVVMRMVIRTPGR